MELMNLLEPEGLVRAFLSEPPEDFRPIVADAGGRPLYGFIARLNLLTTTDEAVRRLYLTYERLVPAFIKRLLSPRVVFIGTTVSEYALFPSGSETEVLKAAALRTLLDSGRQFLIVKDMPMSSPVLCAGENDYSEALGNTLGRSGFLMLFGQALAYVKVDFASIDEFLMRFSRSRRKDLRRKLRSLPGLCVDKVYSGDPFFTDEAVELLYGLYLNVYERSLVHFDKLTMPFFRRVLRDGDCGGVVFIYRHGEKIIGFNLCFIHNDRLVDKYVGFLYPDSTNFNLYFVSWFYNLEFCIRNNLKAFIAGWTDPEIKAYLGAAFTFTRHAVYIKNPVLRFVLGRFKSFFEADRHTVEKVSG